MFAQLLRLFVFYTIIQFSKAGSPDYGHIYTYAGTDNANTGKSYGGDGGPATSASLNNPIDLSLDGVGGLYVCDSDNHILRYINSTGYISLFAGKPQISGYSGDGENALSATFNTPYGIIYSKTEYKLYVADTLNHRVRLIDLSNNNVVTTIAGTGSSGNGNNGSPTTNCDLNSPTSVALDPDLNIYISDKGNHCIRKITGTTLTTVAGLCGTLGSTTGDGTSARLYSPNYIVADSNTNNPALYIADTKNSVIRKLYTKLNSDNMKVVAGKMSNLGYTGDGGSPTNARLYWPLSISIDDGNSMIISDSINNVIRKATNDTNAIIYTIVGGNGNLFDDDSISAVPSALYVPAGTDNDNTGIWLCDTNNNRIRKITFAPSIAPTLNPTNGPTPSPSYRPSFAPSVTPTFSPTKSPSFKPSPMPTLVPSFKPSVVPTTAPTKAPTVFPTVRPTGIPTWIPTSIPTAIPRYFVKF